MTAPRTQLYRNRNKVVARSFYRHLKTQGFSHEQIIDLSTELLDMVAGEMQSQAPVSAK
jgi:hypothetical protein